MDEGIQKKNSKRKGKTLLYRDCLRENLAAVHPLPHPHPSADSETELSVKGALGAIICGRAGEEAEWAEERSRGNTCLVMVSVTHGEL